MSKKRKKKNGGTSEKRGGGNNSSNESKGFWGGLREETRNSIIGITFAIVSIIFILAATGIGGPFGGKLYAGIHYLFGIGYYVVPLLFLLLAINFFRAGAHNIAMPALVAGPFFLIASLGLLSLTTKAQGVAGLGGIVGYYVMLPLTMMLASTLTAIILSAIFVIAILILFDTPLHLGFIFSIFKSLRPTPRDESDVDVVVPEFEDGEDEDGKTEIISLRETPPVAEVLDNEVDEEPVISATTKESLFSKITRPAAKSSAALAPFRFNSTLHSTYTPPPLSLLAHDKGKPGYGDIKANANIIKRSFQNFGIHVEMDEVSVGPSITRYALKPAEGVRLSKITTLQHDLELALAAAPIRIEAPIPGKSLVGIEMPNTTKSTVGLGTLLGEALWAENPNPLYVPLGKGISGLACGQRHSGSRCARR